MERLTAHGSSGSKIAGLMDWFTAATIARENLERWIQAEIRDGKSIKRFKAWEEQDAKGI